MCTHYRQPIKVWAFSRPAGQSQVSYYRLGLRVGDKHLQNSAYSVEVPSGWQYKSYRSSTSLYLFVIQTSSNWICVVTQLSALRRLTSVFRMNPSHFIKESPRLIKWVFCLLQVSPNLISNCSSDSLIVLKSPRNFIERRLCSTRYDGKTIKKTKQLQSS